MGHKNSRRPENEVSSQVSEAVIADSTGNRVPSSFPTFQQIFDAYAIGYAKS